MRIRTNSPAFSAAASDGLPSSLPKKSMPAADQAGLLAEDVDIAVPAAFSSICSMAFGRNSSNTVMAVAPVSHRLPFSSGLLFAPGHLFCTIHFS